jgi:hypothetical protein
VAPEPWATILDDHRRALLAATGELAALTRGPVVDRARVVALEEAM